MSVQAQLNGSELTISIDGVFDIELYDEFNNAYKNYIDQTRKVIIDFSRTDRIDSAALGLMLLLRQKCGADASDIHLVNPNAKVMQSLNMAQFQQLFSIKTL